MDLKLFYVFFYLSYVIFKEGKLQSAPSAASMEEALGSTNVFNKIHLFTI